MKKRKSRFTVFAVLTTITLLTWVAFDAYQRLNKTEFQTIPPKTLSPVDPSLDEAVLGNIEERRFASPEEISSFTPAPQATGTSEEETPEATGPAEASPSAEEE